MTKYFGVFLATLVSLVATQPASAVTMFFDFGGADTSAASNYNDVMVHGAAMPIVLANTIDSSGAGTGIGASVSGFFNGANFDGTQAPTGAATMFATSATRDSAFTHTGFWGNPGVLNPLGQVVFTGLDNSSVYEFSIFGSRMGVGDNRETLYKAIGSNSGQAVLNTSNNVGNIATIAGIAPAAGTITLTVEKGPNNNNGTGFAYLGALRVVSSAAVPEPTTLGLAGLSALGLAFRRRPA